MTVEKKKKILENSIGFLFTCEKEKNVEFTVETVDGKLYKLTQRARRLQYDYLGCKLEVVKCYTPLTYIDNVVAINVLTDNAKLRIFKNGN